MPGERSSSWGRESRDHFRKGSASGRIVNPATRTGVPARRTAESECALSDTHGTLLMVAVTIILAALVLLMVLAMIPSWSWMEPADPPIVITEIAHTSKATGEFTRASRIVLLNNGSTAYENDGLKAIFYKNGQKVCTVQTLNGYRLIPSHHYGVKTLGGEGCRNSHWNPGEELELDLTDHTFYPGIQVTVEIMEKQTGKIISKHSMRA